MGTEKPVRVTKADERALAKAEQRARQLADAFSDDLANEYGDFTGPHFALVAVGRLLEVWYPWTSRLALEDLAVGRVLARQQQMEQ
jgi:hypothetical protein